MARTKSSRSADVAITGSLTAVFFALTLFIIFGGKTWSGMRGGLGSRLLGAAGMPSASTPPASPTPTAVENLAFLTSAIPLETPVPVLATVNAIVTEHALRMQDTPLPTTTPTPFLLLAAIATTEGPSTPVVEVVGPAKGQPTPTVGVDSVPDRPSVTSTPQSTDILTSASRIATSHATATNRRRRTATPTAVRGAPAPVLIGSTARAGAIDLSWSFAGRLGAHDYFDVRVWQSGEPAYGIANVQVTGYTIGSNFPVGDYNWTIAVIRKQGGQTQTLSEAATTLQFSWAPTN